MRDCKIKISNRSEESFFQASYTVHLYTENISVLSPNLHVEDRTFDSYLSQTKLFSVPTIHVLVIKKK